MQSRMLKKSFIILILIFAFSAAIFSLFFSFENKVAYAADGQFGDFNFYLETPDGREVQFDANKTVRIDAVNNATNIEFRSHKWFKTKDREGNAINVELSEKSGRLILKNVEDSGTYLVRFTATRGSQTVVKEATQDIKITPKPVSVIWGQQIELTYNGKQQSPTATTSESGLQLNITGLQREVGDTHLAVANTTNINYTLSNNRRSFSIVPKVIDAQWDSATDFVYNGENQRPNVVAKGVDEEDIELNISEGATSAQSSPYVAEVSSLNSNYTISLSTRTKSYRILQAPSEVVWSDEPIYYNGLVQYPEAVALSISGEPLLLTAVYSGSIEASATPYDVLVETNDTNYKLINNSTSYLILRRPVSAIWNIPTDLVYNGSDQLSAINADFVSLEGTVFKLDISVVGEARFINAGTYTLKASAPSNQNNYFVTNDENETSVASIQKATPIIKFTKSEFVFDLLDEIRSAEYELNALTLEPEFIVNGEKGSNSFNLAGVYEVSAYTLENTNYLSSEVVYTTVIVNSNIFTSETASVKLVLEKGFHPLLSLNVEVTEGNTLPGYKERWARKVVYSYSLDFLSEYNDKTDISGSAKVTVAVPEHFKDKDTIRVLALKDGKYDEQIVKNEGGFITLNLSDDGYFAFTETNDTMITIFTAIFGIIILITVISAVIAVAIRRRRVG